MAVFEGKLSHLLVLAERECGSGVVSGDSLTSGFAFPPGYHFYALRPCFSLLGVPFVPRELPRHRGAGVGGRLSPHAPLLPSRCHCRASASSQHGGAPRAPHVTARPCPPPFPACPAPPPDPGSAAGAAGRARRGPSRSRHGSPGLLPLAQPQVPLHHRQLRRGEGESAARHGGALRRPPWASAGRARGVGAGGAAPVQLPVLSSRCAPVG